MDTAETTTWTTPTTKTESPSAQPDISILRSSEDSSGPVKRKAAERGSSQQSEAKTSEEETKWVLPENYIERLEDFGKIQVRNMDASQWLPDGSFLGAAPLSSASLDTTSSSVVAPLVTLEEKPFEFQPPPPPPPPQEGSPQESQTVPGQTNDSEAQESLQEKQEEEDASLSLWSLTVSGQTKRDRFIPLPWHSGEKHSIPWEPFSKKDGKRRTLLPIESGIVANNLAVPNSAIYADRLEAPQTPEEWMTLWRQAFDDLADQCKDPRDARLHYARRKEIEVAFFTGKNNHHMYLRPGHFEPGEAIKFGLMFANRTYALASRVEVTYEVDMAYRETEKAEKQLNFKRVGNKYVIAISEAKTLEQCSHIAADLDRLRKVCLEEQDEAKVKLIEGWSKILQDKVDDIEKTEGKVEEEKKKDKKDKQEEGDEEEENDDPNDILHALKQRITPTNESAEEKAKRENFGKCCHVIGQKTFRLGDNVIVFPDKAPPFAPVANEIYSQAPVRDPETEKDIHPFDQIVNRGIKGTLWALSTAPEGMANVNWRELRGTVVKGVNTAKRTVPVRLPCHVDGTDDQCVIVDHREIRVIDMPSGDVTEERYSLCTKGSKEALFKVMSVSMNDRYILCLGRVRCHINPVMLLINRKERLVTQYYSDIVITSARLSTEGKRLFEQGQNDVHLLLGFINGNILRCPLGEAPLSKHLVSIYRPDDEPKKPEEETKKKPEEEPNKESEEELKKESEETTTEEPEKEPEKTAVVDPHAEFICKYKKLSPVVVPLSAGCIFGIGSALPVVRIVEHGTRFIAQSAEGLHLFRLNAPEGTERRVTIRLFHNVGYDFQGNLLVLHKANNAVQFVQIHDCRLEVNLAEPSGLRNPIPHMDGIKQSVVIHPSAIMVLHKDGSRRVIELKTYNEIVSRTEFRKWDTEEEREASFLPKDLPTAGKKKPKKATKKKNKKKK